MKKEIEFLIERLVRQEISQLLEYAHPRKEFIYRVENLIKQVIIHLCLIKYNRFLHVEEYVEHWKSELFGWINSLANMDIKKNNSPSNRLDAVMEAMNNMDYLTNINKIKNCIVPKARKENMDINSKAMEYAINECQIALPHIASIIANNDMIGCDNFIKNL